MTPNGSSSAGPFAAVSGPTYGQLTPTALSWFVVGRYWQLVHERPSDLAHFYHSEAHLSRSDGGLEPTQLHGNSQIASYYAGQALGAFVYIRSIDCVPTGAQQYLTQVVGEVAIPSAHGGVQPFRPFYQSLIFASAASPSDPIDTPDLITILSDIVRLESSDEPASTPAANGTAAQTALADPSPSAAPPSENAHSTGGQKAVEVSVSNGHPRDGSSASLRPVASAAEASLPTPEPVLTTSAPRPAAPSVPRPAPSAGAAASSTTTQTSAAPADPAMAAASSIPATPQPSASKQRTWASLAANGRPGEVVEGKSARAAVASTAPAAWSAQRRLSTVSATSSHATPSEVEGGRMVAPGTGTSTSTSTGTGTGGSTSAATKDSSVFVKAVTSAVKEPDLYEALSSFGRVANVHLLPHKGGAFVDFDTPESARRALAASQAKKGIVVPTTQGRTVVSVEHKRTKPTDAKTAARARSSGKRGGSRDSVSQNPKSEGDGFQAVKGRRGH